MKRKFLIETLIVGIIVTCFVIGYYILNFTNTSGGLSFFAYTVTSPTWMLITVVGILYWLYSFVKFVLKKS